MGVEPQCEGRVCGKPTHDADTSLGRRSLGSVRNKTKTGPNPVDNPPVHEYNKRPEHCHYM